MKILVVGGSGLIGTKLVKKLRQLGHEVLAASPSSGVNALTGQGLAKAITGAQGVVLTNQVQRKEKHDDDTTDSGRRLSRSRKNNRALGDSPKARKPRPACRADH